VRSQQPANDPNGAPNPYHLVDGWAKLPPGRSFGQVISVKPDRDGKHIWAFDRCGGPLLYGFATVTDHGIRCERQAGQEFGAGLFVFPHGLFIDKHDNIWVTDSDKAPGKGDQVIELSRDGKVLRPHG